jgi:hypothetical protein
LRWWNHITNKLDFFTEALKSINGFKVNSHFGKFLEDFAKLADWNTIFMNESLDECFIRLFVHFAKHIDKFWWKLCRYQDLSEAFIRRNIEHLDIETMLCNQALSETLLEEWSPCFTTDLWWYVSKYQEVSDEFRGRHQELSSLTN